MSDLLRNEIRNVVGKVFANNDYFDAEKIDKIVKYVEFLNSKGITDNDVDVRSWIKATDKNELSNGDNNFNIVPNRDIKNINKKVLFASLDTIKREYPEMYKKFFSNLWDNN